VAQLYPTAFYFDALNRSILDSGMLSMLNWRDDPGGGKGSRSFPNAAQNPSSVAGVLFFMERLI